MNVPLGEWSATASAACAACCPYGAGTSGTRTSRPGTTPAGRSSSPTSSPRRTMGALERTGRHRNSFVRPAVQGSVVFYRTHPRPHARCPETGTLRRLGGPEYFSDAKFVHLGVARNRSVLPDHPRYHAPDLQILSRPDTQGLKVLGIKDPAPELSAEDAVTLKWDAMGHLENSDFAWEMSPASRT